MFLYSLLYAFLSVLQIGCGYALPLLDEHLAKEAASRHPMQMLPGPLFRLLVFSSRQLQAYRQLHPKAQLPLLGLGKKNAGTAVRKLLSLLGRPHLNFGSASSPPLSLLELCLGVIGSICCCTATPDATPAATIGRLQRSYFYQL